MSEERKNSLDILKKGDNADFDRKNDLVNMINSRINSINLLAEFLLKINGNNISFFRLNNVNWIFLIIAIAVIASWIVSAHLIPTYVLHKNILPWLQR